MWRRLLCSALLGGVICACGCGPRGALGEPAQVVVLARAGVWRTVGRQMRGSLERPVFGVREEKSFEVIQADLGRPGVYGKWARMVVVGSAEDPEIRGLARRAGRDLGSGPNLFRLRDRWAVPQEVLVLVAPSAGRLRETVTVYQDSLYGILRELLVKGERERMFASGVDVELRARLERDCGCAMTFPRVYRAEEGRAPRTLRLYNIEPQRSFLIHWEEGTWPELDPARILDLRKALADIYYPGDEVVHDRIEILRGEVAGRPALRIRGVWEDRKELEGGIFITWALNCPGRDRFFLLDAILYSPSPKVLKHPYLIQLDEILSSFRCAPEATAGS